MPGRGSVGKGTLDQHRTAGRRIGRGKESIDFVVMPNERFDDVRVHEARR
jgi:hypothetical protein